MARYEPQNLLAYRVNGDTLDAFGMKYNQALLRIFQFLNDEREHRTTGTETVEPQPGQLKVEDDKLYIRDSANEAWVLLGKIASHLGLTPSDVGAVANTGKLGAFKGGASADIPSTATEGDFYWCTDKQTVLLYTEDKWQTFLTLDITKLTGYADMLATLVKQDETATTGGTAGKVARTNANGVLDFDITGNAGKLAGVNVAIDHLTDGQTFVYRAATNTITNEDKGVVGSGKTLTIKDGDETLITYAGEEETTLDLGRTAHDNSLTAHASLLGSIFRQPSTAYAVGDVVYVKGAGAKYRLACVTAGTTSADELAIPSGAKAGDSITDGTAIWKVEEIEGMITAIESDGGLVTLTHVDGTTEQLQIVANNAGAHNAVYRGKDLTAYFDSGEMSKAIAAGTFKDIYPGDYITKSITINGTTYSDVKWMVGDLDYFLGHGDTSILTQHHVLMFPDTCLGNSYMNPTNTTEGAYMGSYMYTTMIPLVNAGIQAAFGASHVVSHREAMSKLINATMACASGNGWTGSTYWWSGEWADVLSNLFTENMVYGANIFSSSPQDVCNGCRQVAAFRHDSSLYIGGTKRESWWLRAVARSDAFALVYGHGYAYCNRASYVRGVRPYFLLA